MFQYEYTLTNKTILYTISNSLQLTKKIATNLQMETFTDPLENRKIGFIDIL